MLSETVVFVGKNLLGDCLCTTPSVRAVRRQHPRATIVYVAHDAPHCRVLDGNPDVDVVLYSDALVEAAAVLDDESWVARLPLAVRPPYRVCRLDVFAVHRIGPEVFRHHLSHGFARLLGVSVDSVRPAVAVGAAERAAARAVTGDAPCLVLGMHSTSLVVGPGWAETRKEWVFTRWMRLARHLRDRTGLPVVAVGAADEQTVPSRYWRNLYGLPIRVVAALLERAACTVTIESGLAHLGHAVDAPMVVIYSSDVPREWASPAEATRCRVLYGPTRLVTADDVAAAVETVLDAGSAAA